MSIAECTAVHTHPAFLVQVKDPEKRLAFLQHMVTFAQHPYLLLADKALPFWVKLLQVRATCVHTRVRSCTRMRAHTMLS